MRAVPAVAGMKHDRIFIVVDLPAPFGPRKPTICPFSTLKETSSIAVKGPYRFVRWSTWIMNRGPLRGPDVPGTARQYSTRARGATGEGAERVVRHQTGAVASREPDEARGRQGCEAHFLYVERPWG